MLNKRDDEFPRPVGDVAAEAPEMTVTMVGEAVAVTVTVGASKSSNDFPIT